LADWLPGWTVVAEHQPTDAPAATDSKWRNCAPVTFRTAGPTVADQTGVAAVTAIAGSEAGPARAAGPAGGVAASPRAALAP
ncbi:hypothetical protein, partial [Mycobacterium riyadhense]